MHKPLYIPEYKQIRTLSEDLSQIKASKFIDLYNKGKRYGERIIQSQVDTINNIIDDLCKKVRHRLAFGNQFHITINNLAGLCKCSDKTAYNHIQRLIEARVIRKRFTTHKFNPTDEHLTPCLLLEVNPAILDYQVVNKPQKVEKPVNNQLALPLIEPEIMAQLRQLGIWNDSV